MAAALARGRSSKAGRPRARGVRKAAAVKRAAPARPPPQRELESAILRRCAAGRDRLDRALAAGITIVPVRPGATGLPEFPRPWRRKEAGGRHALRGTAEWYVPRGANPARRMLFLHGGGYTVWAPRDAEYRSIGSRLAAACRACVLSVDYRCAPEHLFPAAYEDTAAALRWVAAHGPGSPTEASPARDVFVCGDSAGGGLALAACVAPPPAVRRVLRGVVVLSGWLDLTASTPSYDTRRWDPARCFGDAVNAGTDRKGGQEEAEVYLGRGGVKKHGRDWRASPFFAPAARLRAMPPALFHVGDYELILDESVLLQQRMRRAGHPDATISVYPRMWHCWHEYAEGGGEGRPLLQARRAVREMGRWVAARSSRAGLPD